jgi:hypothetical protein
MAISSGRVSSIQNNSAASGGLQPHTNLLEAAPAAKEQTDAPPNVTRRRPKERRSCRVAVLQALGPSTSSATAAAPLKMQAP